jgi:phosphatidylglycerophosphatase A
MEPVSRSARLPVRTLRDPVHFLALGFGTGLSPWAPGTAGTALAVLIAWLMADWPMLWRIATVAVVILAGIFVCGLSAKRLGVHDHPAIVLDEIAATLALALMLPRHAVWFASAFILFRFFDIAKPWPIREMDHRLGGGLGIMLDDLMAALYAAACLGIVGYLLTTL